jgi:hypothetical protein
MYQTQTKSGLAVILLGRIPKLKQIQGKVIIAGKNYETIWDEEGNNVEDPDWDISQESMPDATNSEV